MAMIRVSEATRQRVKAEAAKAGVTMEAWADACLGETEPMTATRARRESPVRVAATTILPVDDCPVREPGEHAHDYNRRVMAWQQGVKA